MTSGIFVGVELGALKLLFSDGKVPISMPSGHKELLAEVLAYQRPTVKQ